METAPDYPTPRFFIDGEYDDGAGLPTLPVLDPATGATIASVPCATPRELDRALAAAGRAFAPWRRTPPVERSAILRRAATLLRERAPAIGRNITLDEGKPLAEATGEAASCAEHLEWHAEECRRIYGRVVPARRGGVRQLVVREPVGVCVALTPWNFPFYQALRKVAAAIGAGCTVILKGPEQSPSAIMALAQLLHDAGLPPGVLNVVWGDPAEVSRHLIESPIVRKVSFTGSVRVGKELAALAGAHMKRVTMELGGHAPVLVFADADVERSAEMLARYKLRNAGQTCIAPTRFYVEDRIFDRFVDRFAQVTADTKVGSGLAPDTQMGPLANAARVAAMRKLVADTVERGGTAVTGGTTLPGGGFFFAPTVVTGMPDDALVMTEEPFGPIAAVTRFATVDEAIARANSLPYGLAAYAFTESLKTAARVADEVEAGMVNINHFGMAFAETPFGGVKDSGIGSEGGSETFDGYLTTKFVTQT